MAVVQASPVPGATAAGDDARGPACRSSRRCSARARLWANGRTVPRSHASSPGRPGLGCGTTLDLVRLDLRIVEDATCGSGADRTNQACGQDRAGQGCVVPQDPLNPEIRRGTAGRGDDWVPLQRRNLPRSPGPWKIVQAIHPMLLESLEPLSDPRSGRSQYPGRGGDRLALHRQQDRPCSPVQSGFPSLLAHGGLKAVPFRGREVQFHANSIGRQPQLPVSKLMARCTITTTPHGS
jgi:hypothetical protein